MSDIPNAETTAARYDRTLQGAHHSRLPPGYPIPQPSAAWPAENVALLEHFFEWLSSSGASQDVMRQLYIPMAGHALGLNLKPHSQLDIDADLERALDYIKAKRLSAEWTDRCRVSLNRFRRFLRQQRGQIEVVLRPINYERYCQGLPAWLVEELERYQHLRQRNWRPARLNMQVMRFWGGNTRLWRWLFEHHAITDLTDIKRQYVLDYLGHRLAAGYATSTVNQELRAFHAFLRHLREQDYSVPQALLRIPGLKQPDRLPRFLTDEQVGLLRDDLEARVVQAHSPAQRRIALLDRAAFYLLWQAGLRLSEVEELCLEDLDLIGRRLTVRQGKGRQDRTVYLTDTAVRALQEYLVMRGLGPTEHVFLYRNSPLRKDLVRARIQASGKRVGVKVSPHRLRHTFATQLVNAGCPVTTIQKLLGHRQLNSTMVYARVHDWTVAEDYYAAMARIEGRLGPSAVSESVPAAAAGESQELLLPSVVAGDERVHLLDLIDHLAQPQLDLETRLDLVAQMRQVLRHPAPELVEPATIGLEVAVPLLVPVAQSW